MSKRGCPLAPKGEKAHDIHIVCMEGDDTPVLLVCLRGCGHTQRIAVDLPRPLDDWPAEDVARLFK